MLEEDLLLLLAQLPLALRLELLVDAAGSRAARAWMSSTALFMPSISRRLTISVNSILRIERDSSTRARQDLPRAPCGTCASRPSARRRTSPRACRRPRAAALTRSICFRNSRCARRDLLVGDLFFVEDHQLAHRALAALELLAHLDDFLRDLRRARDRLDDRQLALLDALRDRDFALAREQRHRAHLAQVHADRVVRLVERARREVEVASPRRPRPAACRRGSSSRNRRPRCRRCRTC